MYYCCYVPLSNNLHQSLSSSSPIKTKTDLKFSSLGNCSLKQEPSELLEGISMFFHLYSSMLLTEMFHSALQFSFHHSLLWTISCFFSCRKVSVSLLGMELANNCHSHLVKRWKENYQLCHGPFPNLAV